MLRVSATDIVSVPLANLKNVARYFSLPDLFQENSVTVDQLTNVQVTAVNHQHVHYLKMRNVLLVSACYLRIINVSAFWP